MMMVPDRLGDAARNAGMDPFRYSSMFIANKFHDEGSERRIFNPMWLGMSPATVWNLTAYDDRAGITHTRYLVPRECDVRVDRHVLVVCVRGVCKRDDGAPAEGAIGVYFGPNSPHNFAAHVPASLPQTRKFAQIFAVRMALQRVRNRWSDDYNISTVHVVTDSEYVVKALSEDIDEWRTNGFQDARGGKIANHSEIEILDDLMLDLADDGIRVSFWSVDKAENKKADRLAKGVLGLPPH